VRKIQDEAGDADHAPVEGNLYTYLTLRAFGESSGLYKVKDAEKENPFLLTGLAVVIIIQIIGPLCVLSYAFPRAMSSVALSPELLLRTQSVAQLLATFTLDKLSQMLIGTLFIVLFILNGLYVLEEDLQKNKRIVHMCQVFHVAASRDPRIARPNEFWLFFGAAVNCWVLITCALSMWPCFLIADQGPKEVLFDAFALTFLYNLDDLSGDLGFLSDQWDSDVFGEIYGKLADDFVLMQELKRRRELSFTSDNIIWPGIWITRSLLLAVPALYLLTAVFIDFREEGEPPSSGGAEDRLLELQTALQALQSQMAALTGNGAQR
jgi:hypothetical protein